MISETGQKKLHHHQPPERNQLHVKYLRHHASAVGVTALCVMNHQLLCPPITPVP